ncbi:MAG: hypothetical protein AAF569_08590 [Pseudomonadota bacterium]
MTYSKTNTILLKISCVLWVIWGLVHVLAGFIIISSDASGAVAAVADAVDPALLTMEYPDAAGALLNQHGFNLLWGGLVTIIGGIFIWKLNTVAIFVSALVGGLLDIGYFVFMDLGGYVNFVPGTVMTIVSASAIILSFYAYFSTKKQLES